MTIGASADFTPVRSVEFAVSDEAWAYAEARRAEIGEHFAACQARQPALFNGAIYLVREPRIADGVLSGDLIRTDYASYLYWRERWGEDASVRNCFASGLLHTSDGALILGIMAPHTANAGLIYPPSGSPEDEDMVAGRFDAEGNILRELGEETGLSPTLADAPWLVLEDGPRLAMLRRIDLALDTRRALDIIEQHRAREDVPELSGIHIVRGQEDVVPDRMQPYTLAYIRHAFGG